jgi:hypothetical protein
MVVSSALARVWLLVNAGTAQWLYPFRCNYPADWRTAHRGEINLR